MFWEQLGDCLLIAVAWIVMLLPLVPWFRETRAERLRQMKQDPVEQADLTAARAELEAHLEAHLEAYPQESTRQFTVS